MDSGETPVRGHVRRRPHGRQVLPAHLPREIVTIDVDEAEKTCACGTRKTVIGTIDSEKLDYVPASLRIRQTSRLKYACPDLPRGRRRGAGAAAGRREVAGGRRAARARRRLEVRRSPAAASAQRHLRARGRVELAPLDAVRLGRRRRDGARADRRAAATRGDGDRLPADRRHAGDGARPRRRQFQGAPLDLSRSARPAGRLRRHADA